VSSVFATTSLSHESIIDENRLFPIVCEQDIPKEYQGAVAPISCLAVVVVSYYKCLPMNAVYTKKGIHPFATYVTNTYSISSGETFLQGAQGSYDAGDKDLQEYVRKHGLLVEQQYSVLSETELMNSIAPSLMNQNPVMVWEESSNPYLVIGIQQNDHGTILLAYSPLQKEMQQIPLATLAQQSLFMTFIYPHQEEKKTLMEEISLLVKKRFEAILNEWKWDLEIWFYKQINSFLSGFHTRFPWFSPST
jgi:hypothetical protein